MAQSRRARFRQCRLWVKTGKARTEQIMSALPPKADLKPVYAFQSIAASLREMKFTRRPPWQTHRRAIAVRQSCRNQLVRIQPAPRRAERARSHRTAGRGRRNSRGAAERRTAFLLRPGLAFPPSMPQCGRRPPGPALAPQGGAQCHGRFDARSVPLSTVDGAVVMFATFSLHKCLADRCLRDLQSAPA